MMLEEATKFIRQAYRNDNRLDDPGGVIYSDLSPMAYAIAPELFELREMYVRVETQGEYSRGSTVADLRKATTSEPNISVAMGVDGDAVTELWAELVSTI